MKTRESYLHLNAQIGTYYRPEPEFLEDVDGAPVGVKPSDALVGIRGGFGVTLADLEAVGLTPADVPNLTIIRPKENH